MNRTLLLASIATATLLTACTEIEHCDMYVNYMCDCHAEEDCSALQNTYQMADDELQEECAIALDEQYEIDDAEGLSCD